jgi:hypothetical protein
LIEWEVHFCTRFKCISEKTEEAIGNEQPTDTFSIGQKARHEGTQNIIQKTKKMSNMDHPSHLLLKEKVERNPGAYEG